MVSDRSSGPVRLSGVSILLGRQPPHDSPRGLVRALHRLLHAVALLAIAPAVLLAQSGTIKGTVTDTATGPVIGAVVTIEGSGLLTQTSSRGTYEFRGVTAGSHVVRVRALGHTRAKQ
jgi:hypothetical protein